MKKLWLCTLVVLASVCLSAQTVTTLSKPYSRSLDAATDTGDGAIFFATPEAGVSPVTWTMSTAVTGFSGVSIQLQGSINKNTWQVITASTNTTGESLSASGVVAHFVKCVLVSKTGTGTATCDVSASSAQALASKANLAGDNHFTGNQQVDGALVVGTTVQAAKFVSSGGPSAATTCVFEGDSITSGLNLSAGQDWPSQFVAIPQFSGCTKYNVATSGETIDQMQTEYAAQVAPHKPTTGQAALLTIMAGTNNILHTSDTAAALYAKLNSYWTTAKADGFLVAAITMPPCTSNCTTAQDVVRQATNALIRSGSGYDYLIDADSFFVTSLDATMWQSDHLHPTAVGSIKMASYVATVLSQPGLVAPVAAPSSGSNAALAADGTTAAPGIAFAGTGTAGGYSGFHRSTNGDTILTLDGIDGYDFWRKNSGTAMEMHARAVGTATSGQNYDSHFIGWQGSCWTGTAATWDTFVFQVNSTSTASTLKLAHSYGCGQPIKVQLPGSLVLAGANGETVTEGQINELITLSTVGTTTDSTTYLLPGFSFIKAVACYVQTAITTATAWSVGDAATATRFCSAQSTLTLGTRVACMNHRQASVTTDAAGPVQSTQAKLRITTTGTPAAGVLRCTTYYEQYFAPSN